MAFAPPWPEAEDDVARLGLPGASRMVPVAFFERGTESVARDLIGKLLVSGVDGVVTGGRIVETEAYLGADDPGSHAATRGVTKRNAVMYGPPGRAYVYFTYGNHHMLNLVTDADGVAGGVLIRAIEPLFGLEEMMRRRSAARRANRAPRANELAGGPGRLASALGVDLGLNGSRLGEGALAVYDDGRSPERIATSGRIGLSSGHEYELRFFVVDSPFTSSGRIGPKAPRRRDPK